MKKVAIDWTVLSKFGFISMYDARMFKINMMNIPMGGTMSM